MKQKKGKLSTSHRYDLLPLLPSGPGGVQRELVVYDFPVANIRLFLYSAINLEVVLKCSLSISQDW